MRNLLSGALRSAILPAAAIVLSLLVGAVLILIVGNNPLSAYGALLNGSFGGTDALGTTLEKATPLVLTGLAVSVAFKAGLFNIGAQGQLLFGAAVGAGVGYAIGLPALLHVPLALAAGAAAGGAFAAIAGVLKVSTGAHEVITTIMLNFIATNFTDWLVSSPWKEDGQPLSRTPPIRPSADIPAIGELPLGFLIVVLVAVATWWIFRRTVVGYQVTTIGLNPDAGSYAGMPVKRLMVGAMVAAGALAGLGGAIESLGVNGRYQPGFQGSLGFDGITIALLGRTNPLGMIPAALLVGAMRAGGATIQFESGVSPEIVDVILALMLFLVAAPIVLQRFLRMRGESGQALQLSTGWGR